MYEEENLYDDFRRSENSCHCSLSKLESRLQGKHTIEVRQPPTHAQLKNILLILTYAISVHNFTHCSKYVLLC